MGDAFGDLAAYTYGVSSGNEALAFEAIQAMSESRAELYSTAIDLTISLTEGPGALGGASTIAGFIKSFYDLGATVMDQADSTSANIANEYSGASDGLQGVAYGTGQIVPINNQSASGQYGVQLSSNGISFSTLSDANGDYQIFTNVNISNFDYATVTIRVLDPITQAVLGTRVIDLSNASALCKADQKALAVFTKLLPNCYCTGPACLPSLIDSCLKSWLTVVNVYAQLVLKDCALVIP